jgi:hypothetical protein
LAGKAAKAFKEALEHWKRKQKEGAIDSFEAFFLDYYGGDLSGFLLIRGDREKIRTDHEFENRTMRVAALVPNLGIIDAFTGDELQRRMTEYQKALAQLV